jgi:hypothetical protein
MTSGFVTSILIYTRGCSDVVFSYLLTFVVAQDESSDKQNNIHTVLASKWEIMLISCYRI